MMKKKYREGSPGAPAGRKMIDVKFEPAVNEGPGTISGMEKQIHRLEDKVRRQEGEISTLRELLHNQSVIGHWEVPG